MFWLIWTASGTKPTRLMVDGVVLALRPKGGLNSGCQLNANITVRLPPNIVNLLLAERGCKSAVDDAPIGFVVSPQNMDAGGSFR
jgi:hypothetical protein